MAERITEATPIRFRDPLPEAADVVVVGGGVMGVFTALYLARAGQKVVLCEKGRIAGEQSSRNWGWIRQQGRDPAELPVMMRARSLWLEAEAETGGACGLRVTGCTFLSHKARSAGLYEDWVRLAADHGLESHMLGRREMAERFGDAANVTWATGVHTPSDISAEPWQAVPAVARLAQAEGAVLREGCAVRALSIEAGAVTGVVTEAGTVRAGQVVLAAGAWSALFARRHGVSIPQLAVRGTVLQTAPLPQVLNGCVCDETLGIRRREDGGYSVALNSQNSYFLGPDSFRHVGRYLPLLRSAWRDIVLHPCQPAGFPDGWRTPRRWAEDEVSPFERQRVLEPVAPARLVRRITRAFARRFPGLGRPPVRQAWAGLIDTMPDVVPVVDRVPDLPVLIMATGLSGHGFGIAPGYAEIIARMVLGQAPGFDMARFRFSRFSDGSPIALGPEL
jgi:glycine/D-amino acid oxidase-like deaminating enzyme